MIHYYHSLWVSRKPVLRTVPYPYSRKPLLLFENSYWDSKPHTHKKVSPAEFSKIILFEAGGNNDLFWYWGWKESCSKVTIHSVRRTSLSWQALFFGLILYHIVCYFHSTRLTCWQNQCQFINRLGRLYLCGYWYLCCFGWNHYACGPGASLHVWA